MTRLAGTSKTVHATVNGPQVALHSHALPQELEVKSATVLSDKELTGIPQNPEKVLSPRRSRPVVRLVPGKPIFNETRGACPTNSTFQVASHSKSCGCVGPWVKEQRPMFMQKGTGMSRCLPQGTPTQVLGVPRGPLRKASDSSNQFPFNFQHCIWVPPP